MNDIWRKFKGDFNSLTDAQIETEREQSQAKIDEHTEWTEAVSSWIAAGRPR